MTRVATVGYEAANLVHDSRTPLWLGESLGRDDLQALVNLAAEKTADGGHLVVIHPAWRAEPTLGRIETVRASLDTVRLVAYGARLPPLAGAVLGALADALAPHLAPAGLLLAALPLLERQLLVVTWLRRVTGLTEPPPSLWQHLASWLPGTAFVASTWPEPCVRFIRRGEGPLDLPRPRSTVGLAVADHNGDPEWVDRCLIPALGTPRRRDVAPSPFGPLWWGSNRLIETVVYPLGLGPTADALARSLQLQRCHWCREEIASSPCPFCGLPADARWSWKAPDEVPAAGAAALAGGEAGRQAAGGGWGSGGEAGREPARGWESTGGES
jgi:hypothetical protein